MGMSDDMSQWDTESLGVAGNEERIFVSVRLRPLNERERLCNDVSDWECINNTTIIYKKSLPERSLYPTAYAFDRVFSPDCATKKVYEEGAKEVALSVLNGFNSSIFAYGQTSSGKTYTMRGITEFAISDLFHYIEEHQEIEFVLKFSAMEIYNEVVRDLLSHDNTPLRLLDDPERGTIVEKLTEETLESFNQLQELLAVCDAQRHIGETSLNEMSSRSHQIIRLTVESSAREYFTAENTSTLSATVNFIDLAGSERASQTQSVGARLKEGSHINRSLLTLGTVIRKLSKGRTGHIPYRDSKLTRILQNSLGGNARTAIICTMSPAHSHVEQSKNTLLFASCAKEVTTRAQVNVVMSDKALVKQLQREMARLENELKNAAEKSGNPSAALLKEKEILIEKMDREMKELIRQRDLAELRIQELLQSTGSDNVPKLLADADKIMEAQLENAWMDTVNRSPDAIFLQSSKSIEEDEFEKTTAAIKKMMNYGSVSPDFTESNEEASVNMLVKNNEPSLLLEKENEVKNLQQKVQQMQKAIDSLMGFQEKERDNCSLEVQVGSSSKTSTLPRSKSCRPLSITHETFDYTEKVDEVENIPQSEGRLWHKSQTHLSLSLSLPVMKYAAQLKEEVKSPEDEETDDMFSSPTSFPDTKFNSPGRHLRKLARQDSRKSVLSIATDIRSPMIKPSSNRGASGITRLSISEFKRMRKEIIELWACCNVPLVHRTYFFLLFKGDPSDFIYMEVELRRLLNLKDLLFEGENSTDRAQTITLTTSLKALDRERLMLSKHMERRFSTKYRESLYKQWGIDLKSKLRKLQLARLIWTDTEDMAHIKDSAEIVAKIIGFQEPGQGPKEMFGLSLLHGPMPHKPKNWISSAASVL